MDIEKLNFIKNKLGHNYLYKLDMDIDAEENMPAYEFYHSVIHQFEYIFPELNNLYNQQLEANNNPKLYSKEKATQILQGNLNNKKIADIYLDYHNHYNGYSVSRAFFSPDFRNSSTILLNQAKSFDSLESFLNYLKNNPSNSSGNVNNTKLFNHAKFAANNLVFQYAIKNKWILPFGNKFYFAT